MAADKCSFFAQLFDPSQLADSKGLFTAIWQRIFGLQLFGGNSVFVCFSIQKPFYFVFWFGFWAATLKPFFFQRAPSSSQGLKLWPRNLKAFGVFNICCRWAPFHSRSYGMAKQETASSDLVQPFFFLGGGLSGSNHLPKSDQLSIFQLFLCGLP